MRRHSHSMRRRSSSRLIPRHELFAGFQQGEVSSRARVEHARRAGGFEESGESRRSVERVQTGGVRERDAGLRRDGDDDRARAVGRHGGATVGLELLRGLRLEEHRLRRRDAPAAREAVAQSHLDRAGAATGAVGRGGCEEERGGFGGGGRRDAAFVEKNLAALGSERDRTWGCAPTVRRGWRTAVGTLVHERRREPRRAVRGRGRRADGIDEEPRGDGTYLGNVKIVRAEVELIACVANGRRRTSARSDPGGEGGPRRDEKGGTSWGTTDASRRTTQGDHASLRRGDEIIKVAEFHRAGESRHRVDSPATQGVRGPTRVRHLIPVPVPVPVPRGRPSASPTRARKSFSPQFWLTGVSREPTRARVASRRYRDDGVDAIARRMYSYLRST